MKTRAVGILYSAYQAIDHVTCINVDSVMQKGDLGKNVIWRDAYQSGILDRTVYPILDQWSNIRGTGPMRRLLFIIQMD